LHFIRFGRKLLHFSVDICIYTAQRRAPLCSDGELMTLQTASTASRVKGEARNRHKGVGAEMGSFVLLYFGVGAAEYTSVNT